MSYPNYVYSIFAFIGFTLAVIPLFWHINAWNVGTCLYMTWTAIACLNQFINSVVWNGNVINWAPVWCDISSRIIVGTAIAIPACSLCINRRLYHISRLQSPMTQQVEKRREIAIDFAIGLGIPIVFMITAYIPQGHRFDIFGDIGCYPASYVTPVHIALVSVPPVAVGCVTAVYSILSIRAFYQRRERLKELMRGNQNMSTDRYFRLMCIAGIEVVCMIPLGSYVIYRNCTVKGGISPWISWEDTHYNFSRVVQIPAAIWRSDRTFEANFEFNRWQVIICSFIFFAFFGFAEEARENYRAAVRAVTRRIGRLTKDPMESNRLSLKDHLWNKHFTARKAIIRPFSIRVDISPSSETLDSISTKVTVVAKKPNKGQPSLFRFFASSCRWKTDDTIRPDAPRQTIGQFPIYAGPLNEKQNRFRFFASSPFRTQNRSNSDIESVQRQGLS